MDFEYARAVLVNRLIDLELEQWDARERGYVHSQDEAMYAFVVLKNCAKKMGFDVDESIIRQTAMLIRARG